MNSLLPRNTFKIIAALAVVGTIFSPNGFFSGHRTVILNAETTRSTPTVHIAGDKNSVKANLYGSISSVTGIPVSGAMITAFSADKSRRTTAYSRTDGSYTLPLNYVGELTFRIRTPYFADSTQTIIITDGDSKAVDFKTQRIADPVELSESLTASAHAAMIKWPKDTDRATFVSQCNFCHQIGNSLTRRPRDKKEWQAVVDRMEGYLVFVTDDEKESISSRLHETFQGEAIKAIQTFDVSPTLSNAIIEEWNAGDAMSFIHDADVGHDDRLYGADEGHDIIWELNRKTGEVLEVKLPEVDLPVGGKFSGLALPIGVFTGSHGPHSTAETEDGRIWITNSLSSRLMAYTPGKNQFETYNIGADSMYLHTIRAGHKGRLWFTVAASNQVGVFDPATEQLDLLDLPSNGFARWLADAMLPTMNIIGGWFPRKNLPITLSHHKWFNLGRDVLNMPYGIDINPIDGSAWYVKLYANKIGRIDPETLAVEEFDTPAVGPRRPRFAPNGTLWIPGFDTGVLMRFSPETRQFKQYQLPKLAPNEYETPYALNVHPDTGVVWMTSNMSDRIFSFDPNTESFTSYPLPTRVSFLRDIVFTQDGRVCSSNSNLPSYAIEGGLGGFICIAPEANTPPAAG
jgi:virginiamycin B lyase